LKRELDVLEENDIVNLRILAASEASYMRGSVSPVIQRSPGALNDSLLQGLDFLLAEMAKRSMHAVLYLNNYWEWSGGMVAYNVWSGEKPVDPYDTTKGWGAYMDFAASFYSNQQANRMFRTYIKTLLTRTNTVNGRLYSQDPTIMAWQLANEPRPGSIGERSERNLLGFYRWIDETAGYIHSLDTNHLVSTGSEGSVGSLLSAEYYLEAHASPHIDYLTMHVWPFNWEWFDPKRIPETLPVAERKAVEYVGKHLALARLLHKPIVVEEFGLGRDGGTFMTGTPTSARDRFYATFLRSLVDSARTGAPLAGFNFWAWGGEGGAQHPDGVWREGDSFVGDPPQEPQGQNSIFNSDRSTLMIIRENATKMLRLEVPDTLLVPHR
jgi:mannan endo-1,4-beta-mannosidase